MAGRITSAALLFVLLAAGSLAAAAEPDTTWTWASGKRSLDLYRQSGGPLIISQVSSPMACPSGENGGQSLWGASLLERAGIAVAADGSFSYDGPTDGEGVQGVPRLKISGRVAGASLTGTYELYMDFGDCRATSGTIRFDAACTDGCPATPRKPRKHYVTVFPGVGFGSRGLHMRGVAKFGMTEKRVRALHRSKPSYVDRPKSVGGSREVSLLYNYGETHAFYNFLGYASHKGRLSRINIQGSKIRTRKGITFTSTPSEFKQAYPSTRCRQSTLMAVAIPVSHCSLRTGGAVTVFDFVKRGNGTWYVERVVMSR